MLVATMRLLHHYMIYIDAVLRIYGITKHVLEFKRPLSTGLTWVRNKYSTMKLAEKKNVTGVRD